MKWYLGASLHGGLAKTADPHRDPHAETSGRKQWKYGCERVFQFQRKRSKTSEKRYFQNFSTLCNQQVGGSSPSTSSIVKRRSLHSASHWREKLRIRSRLFPLRTAIASLDCAARTGDFSSKVNMGEFPSGQRGQTVNLLSVTSVVRIHLPPPKIPNIHQDGRNLLSSGEGGFERRLLATCQWHVATAVAFSAEKANPPSPTKNPVCDSMRDFYFFTFPYSLLLQIAARPVFWKVIGNSEE